MVIGHSRRTLRTLAVTVATLATLVLGAAIVPSSAAGAQFSALTNIRVGRHATYDRVVLDFSGPVPSSFRGNFTARLIADPSGKRVSLPGNTFVSVVSQGATAFGTYNGRKSFTTPALRNVRAVAITGDFEAVLSIGLGVRHRTWLHVFTLPNPSRLVIDVGR
jgi:hypothetical protein